MPCHARHLGSKQGASFTLSLREDMEKLRVCKRVYRVLARTAVSASVQSWEEVK